MYWLSNIKPGVAVLAYCNMDTEGNLFNPRTYKQSHAPTVVQGGRALMDPPWVFFMLKYFEKISPKVESL